ncbi:MAG TPA: Uxx-star family glutaredoxin-like (seleno)protein [Spirochaetota bacterium]|nr:Uxx-star family glutaredoxin-like (seleno)protein [Spirochaetota bacterium]HOM37573.1 Uxx-star family glutaredoxin-like (seleno)protein [Spirochaetota bacterium]HPQ49456.1 Uxx-star family glutaredoxin-like (seleno)protein [Spirochaetota bacterium]
MEATIYTTPTCPYCVKAKDYLKKLGVSIKEYDVSKDPIKAQEMVQKSGQMGVPVIVLKGQVIVGFNKPKIDQLLNFG